MKIEFGNVGVCVGGYTKDSLYALLTKHNLETLMDNRYLNASKLIGKNMYLQPENHGKFKEDSSLNIHEGYIHFITDMENYLHILRVGILDADAANDLVEELYLQGLIKPRNESWDVLTLVT